MQKILFKILIILIVILFIIGLIIMFIGFKEKNTKTTTTYNLNDPLILENYKLFSDETGDMYKEDISNKSTSKENLTEESKIIRALRHLNDNDLTAIPTEGIGSFQVNMSNFKKYYLNMFNEEFKGLTKSFVYVNTKNNVAKILTEGAIEVEYENNNLILNLTGIDGCTGASTCYERHAKLKEAYGKDNYLYLVENQILLENIYEETEEDIVLTSSKIYKDLTKKEILANDDDYEKYLEKGSTVTIVLKKGQNGEYSFVKSIVE